LEDASDSADYRVNLSVRLHGARNLVTARDTTDLDREAQVFKLALRVAAAEQRNDSAPGIGDFRDIPDHCGQPGVFWPSLIWVAIVAR
jgi:hypothetical protein